MHYCRMTQKNDQGTYCREYFDNFWPTDGYKDLANAISKCQISLTEHKKMVKSLVWNSLMIVLAYRAQLFKALLA